MGLSLQHLATLTSSHTHSKHTHLHALALTYMHTHPSLYLSLSLTHTHTHTHTNTHPFNFKNVKRNNDKKFDFTTTTMKEAWLLSWHKVHPQKLKSRLRIPEK